MRRRAHHLIYRARRYRCLDMGLSLGSLLIYNPTATADKALFRSLDLFPFISRVTSRRELIPVISVIVTWDIIILPDLGNLFSF